MKKQELIEKISASTGQSIKDVSSIVEATITTITNALTSGDVVDIYGFAKFEAVEQAARIVKNPKTGETKENPAKMVPKCRFKGSFKEKLLG